MPDWKGSGDVWDVEDGCKCRRQPVAVTAEDSDGNMQLVDQPACWYRRLVPFVTCVVTVGLLLLDNTFSVADLKEEIEVIATNDLRGPSLEAGRHLLSVVSDDISFPSHLPNENTDSQGQWSSRHCRHKWLENVCLQGPCLRRLDQPVDEATTSVTRRLSTDVRRQISRIPGQLDRSHLDVIPMLTEMQWSLAVHGSVAELGGVETGKATSLLSHLVDLAAGERQMVVDPFNSTSVSDVTSTRLLTAVPHFSLFKSTVSKFDLAVVDSHRSTPNTSQPTVYVYRGTAANWTALDEHLNAWKLPQFRFVVVRIGDSNEDAMAMSSRLNMAVCLLRDGGLIAVEMTSGTATSSATTEALISGFLAKHGDFVIAPLLRTENTLYLTTTTWRRTYMEFLANNFDSRTHTGKLDSYSAFKRQFYVLR